MKLPLSWLREHVRLPADAGPREVAAGLIRLGVEVESVEPVGDRPHRAARRRPGALLRGVHRQQRQDHPLVPGRRRCGERPRHRLRRAQLRRRRPGRRRAARGRAARRLRHLGAQDLRPRLRRDDLLGPRARARRRPPRHPGAAAGPHGRRGRDRGCSSCGTTVLDLEITPDRGYEHVRARDRPELSHAFDAPYRDPAADVAVPAAGRPRLAGADRGPGRLRPLLRPRRHRARPGRAVAAVAAPPAAAVRRAADLARRRRDQLRDAGDRPADARLRPGHGRRRAGRAAGPAGGAAGHPRRRRARPGPRRPAGHRRLRPDRRWPGSWAAPAPRSAPATTAVVLEAAHWEPPTIVPRRPPAPAAERGGQALRARASTRRWPRSRLQRAVRPAGDLRRRHAPAPGFDGRRRPGGSGARSRCRPTCRSASPASRSREAVVAPPARAGRLHGRRRRHAAGHPAVLAARPGRPGRPGRGGRPAGGLRRGPVRAADRRRPAAG